MAIKCVCLLEQKLETNFSSNIRHQYSLLGARGYWTEYVVLIMHFSFSIEWNSSCHLDKIYWESYCSTLLIKNQTKSLQFSVVCLGMRIHLCLFVYFCLIITGVKTIMQKLSFRRSGWVVLNKNTSSICYVMTVLVKICCSDYEQYLKHNGMKYVPWLVDIILIRCHINKISGTVQVLEF